MLPIMFNDNWFENTLDNMFNANNKMYAKAITPATNVKEYTDKYVMEIAAAGMKKEHCKVSINDEGNLVVSVENKTETKQEDKQHKYLRKEFGYYSYNNKYILPEDSDKDKISAKVEDGVLTITIPKFEQKKNTSKEIEIV